VLFASASSALAQAHLQHFGYQIDDTTRLSDIGFYTDVAVYRPGTFTSDIRALLGDMASHQMKAMIDLTSVLWCDTPAPRHLCGDYLQRLAAFAASNDGYLTSGYLVAFYVIDEPILSGIPISSVNLAIQAVKARFPGIPTSYVEAYLVIGAMGASYPLSPLVDWFGIDKYFMKDPAADPCPDNLSSCGASDHVGYSFKKEVEIAEQLMSLSQKFIYVLDGWFEPRCHGTVNPACPSEGGLNEGDMEGVASAWYAMATSDPRAIFLAVFIWPSSPGLIGTEDLPCNVKLRHQSIGREITGRSDSPPRPVCSQVPRVVPFR
jgi:hypothetical protein